VSTLQMERGGGVVVPSPTEQRVPDHVPAEVAAEHPDAASVVAREPELPSPSPYSVRTVDRAERRTRAGVVLALAACALVAALVPGSTSEADPPVTTVTAGSTTTASPASEQPATERTAAAAACPPGTSVVVSCGPSTCGPVPPWSPFFGPCGPSTDSRR